MANKQFDYLIVGAGLYGATFAQQAAEKGLKCLVIDRRDHVAGNIYSEDMGGIQVHKYGPHIFHTAIEEVWEYVNRFIKFNHFHYEPIANYKGELYNMPFNMATFHQMWGVSTPAEAVAILDKQKKEMTDLLEKEGREPANLEEQAIALIGRDIYEKLIKGYTQKQWGRPCDELPSFIIRRLPVRLRYDNNYFNDPYEGIPIGGYTKWVENMLDNKLIEVRLGVDYFADREGLRALADKVVYTGPIDAYFDYCYGELQYRSLRFEEEDLPVDNYQGTAGMNYTDAETPYTRVIEHKHFEFIGTAPAGYGDSVDDETLKRAQGHTVITREYSAEWKLGDEPYYAVNNDENQALYEKYKKLADAEENVIFGGRLAEYKYYDMDKVIDSALKKCREVL